MNAVKRFFITPYSMGMMIGALHSSYMVYQLGFNTAWTGAMVATLPGALFFARVFLINTARTGSTAPLLWLGGAIGTALVYWINPAAQLPMVYALGFGLIGSLLYDFWFSRYSNRDTQTLAVGETLPDFELYQADGSSISSQEITQSAALLMFYRGNWCPLCMAQIKEVAAQYKELDERGVKVYLISNQSEKNTEKLAAKFDVPMIFLVDKDLAAATKLGIVAKGGTPIGIPGYDVDTNLPTVVMTDTAGKIIFADLTDNYRVRPEPETFLKVLDEHQIAYN